jgi:Ribonuclease G/E
LFKSRYAIITPDAPGINLSRNIRDEEVRMAILEVAHEVMDGPYGLILRSACENADPEEIGEDIAAVLALATQVMNDVEGPAEMLVEGDGPHTLAWRDWTDPADIETEAGGFERLDLFDQIDRLAGPGVPLGGGAEMYVEPTRALVAVDVNTGGDTSPSAGLKANMAAARLLPRELRLRGLGGQVVVDLAPMPKKDRRGFEATLRKAFKGDSIDTALVGWTPLGNYELQRQRARAPLNWTA